MSDTISFTFDDAGAVLALVKITDDGDLLTRKAGDWAAVEGEDSTVFDRDIVDVRADQVDPATHAFDTDASSLERGSVKAFLTAV